ncbi:hypothetical protein CLF_105673 [Clonorchis sinensis]|uniref:Uncharacterized protein n=1 Tax=Clonorchis sinensis TaxID=79923 RepID=G7YDY6_CLOSI|nr:hypothetical protein CLF_105673 [Clonorchis sinensis]
MKLRKDIRRVRKLGKNGSWTLLDKCKCRWSFNPVIVPYGCKTYSKSFCFEPGIRVLSFVSRFKIVTQKRIYLKPLCYRPFWWLYLLRSPDSFNTTSDYFPVLYSYALQPDMCLLIVVQLVYWYGIHHQHSVGALGSTRYKAFPSVNRVVTNYKVTRNRPVDPIEGNQLSSVGATATGDHTRLSVRWCTSFFVKPIDWVIISVWLADSCDSLLPRVQDTLQMAIYRMPYDLMAA